MYVPCMEGGGGGAAAAQWITAMDLPKGSWFESRKGHWWCWEGHPEF